MKLPRLSVVKLMAVVGVVAINLAAGRALLTYNPPLLVALALPALVLQVALLHLIRRRGRIRAWAAVEHAERRAVGD